MNDYPIVVEGLAALLAQDTRLSIVEINTQVTPDSPVDVVLFDAFAAGRDEEDDVIDLVSDARFGSVVIYTWNLEPTQIDRFLGLGVDGYLSKKLNAAELADSIVRVNAGEKVVLPTRLLGEPMMADWPVRQMGLTAREAEIVALITQGLTNEEIAQASYLSINSVKTHIRAAYRKIGVARRSQAVRWGIENGMLPKASRSS